MVRLLATVLVKVIVRCTLQNICSNKADHLVQLHAHVFVSVKSLCISVFESESSSVYKFVVVPMKELQTISEIIVCLSRLLISYL